VLGGATAVFDSGFYMEHGLYVVGFGV